MVDKLRKTTECTGWRTYEYACDECMTIEERLVKYPDRDSLVCDTCGEPLRRLMCAPMVMEASYPDGTSVSPIEKEWSRLNVEKAGLDHIADRKERQRIEGEMAKVKSGQYKRIKR